jgi:hypothetical protein
MNEGEQKTAWEVETAMMYNWCRALVHYLDLKAIKREEDQIISKHKNVSVTLSR